MWLRIIILAIFIVVVIFPGATASEPNIVFEPAASPDIVFNTATIDSSGYVFVGESNEAPYFEFCFPAINDVNEAAQALRGWCEVWSTFFGGEKTGLEPSVDFKVTIGDKTRTASFEDFFRWMGFEGESDIDLYAPIPIIHDSNEVILFTHDANVNHADWRIPNMKKGFTTDISPTKPYLYKDPIESSNILTLGGPTDYVCSKHGRLDSLATVISGDIDRSI